MEQEQLQRDRRRVQRAGVLVGPPAAEVPASRPAAPAAHRDGPPARCGPQRLRGQVALPGGAERRCALQHFGEHVHGSRGRGGRPCVPRQRRGGDRHLCGAVPAGRRGVRSSRPHRDAQPGRRGGRRAVYVAGGACALLGDLPRLRGLHGSGEPGAAVRAPRDGRRRRRHRGDRARCEGRAEGRRGGRRPPAARHAGGAAVQLRGGPIGLCRPVRSNTNGGPIRPLSLQPNHH
mmetsp:Transcript_3676/g.8834  ORF Transcript_3676/g.8834 Transcript_3676/m.8834 type:complete len:233 (+) Transcript_3676:158-856(+)